MEIKNIFEYFDDVETSEIDWILGKEDWENLACIGAIHTELIIEKGKSSEWHYYISNRDLSADELLNRARKEWSVEMINWLLDMHFCKDFCRAISQNTQENLNIIRKILEN